MRDPLAGSWYPSCVCVLTVRFDESIQLGNTGEKPTVKSANEERRTPGKIKHTVSVGQATSTPFERPRRTRRLDELDVQDDGTTGRSGQRPTQANPDVAPASNESTGNDAPDPGTSPLTFGTDGFTVIANRVPKKGTFGLEHPRSAGKFSLTFDYHEFPVDARLIRAVGVEIHLGAVSAEDYARGMAGEKDSDGRPLSIIKTGTGGVDPWTGRPQPNDATILLYGTCDTWDVDHGESGSTIVLEGRDVRSIFIDAKISLATPKKQHIVGHAKQQTLVAGKSLGQIDLTQPIDQVVVDIIRSMGLEHDLQLVVLTDQNEWPGGVVPSPGDSDGLTRVRQGAQGSSTSGTPSTGTKTSYWDLITNYCMMVGAIPTFLGTNLWIRPAPKVFDIINGTSRLPTPFAGGTPRQVGNETIRARRLVFGRDIKRLRFQRKFAGAVAPTVQCISYDDRAEGMQKLIFGQWPPEGSVQAQAKADSELLRVPMWGIRNQEQLKQIAHGIYEEVGRGETGGTCETHNLASYGGNNSDPDLLRLRPMEPVEFVVDAQALSTIAPIVSELTDHERRTFSEEVDAVQKRIGDRVIARALVGLARGAIRELLAFYQVVGVTYEWGGGLKIGMQFQNYITPRQQAQSDSADDLPQSRAQKIRATRVDEPGAHKKARATAGTTAASAHARAAAAIQRVLGGGISTAEAMQDIRKGKRPRPALHQEEGEQPESGVFDGE